YAREGLVTPTVDSARTPSTASPVRAERVLFTLSMSSQAQSFDPDPSPDPPRSPDTHGRRLTATMNSAGRPLADALDSCRFIRDVFAVFEGALDRVSLHGVEATGKKANMMEKLRSLVVPVIALGRASMLGKLGVGPLTPASESSSQIRFPVTQSSSFVGGLTPATRESVDYDEARRSGVTVAANGVRILPEPTDQPQLQLAPPAPGHIWPP
ncbi:hypothetical protein BC834DRAFT_1016070, partial [Gloeopeniophorella convolvens]